MRVLVTGVSGFVGRRLGRALLAAGHRVVGTFAGEAPDLPGVELHEVDLLEREALADAVAAARPELVYHLAALSHVGESWRRPGDYFRVNVLGTEAVLRVTAGTPLLLASSAEVYGQVPESEQPIREERLPSPASPYGLTKAAAERLVLAAGGRAARLFNLVGSGQVPSYALPSFARQLAAIRAGERPATLAVGNLAVRRDFLHVDDAVAALGLIGERGRAGEVYNVASGAARPLRELVEELVEISGVEAGIQEDAARLRPLDPAVLAGDPSRLQGLGWAPRRTVREALEALWGEAAGGGPGR